MIEKITIENDAELSDLPPITVGEILFAFKEYKAIFKTELKKEPETFYDIPIKIVIKRISNNMVVDLLGIRRIEMNKEGTGIWFICSVNQSDSIFIHNKSIVKLKISTKPISEIKAGFSYLKSIFDKNQKKLSNHFYDLPVRIIVMEGTEGKNEKVIDTLDIVTILMDDIGAGVFCHSFVNDITMIENNPDVRILLDESEKKYAELMQKLNKR